MILVISSSLNPDSRSRVLARAACECLERAQAQFQLIDLNDIQLPICDGATCYADNNVQHMAKLVSEAKGILIASPIYNYDVNSVIKNFVELTGKAWTEKVVGFLCAAGGQGSFMAPMGLANSLMLDFRTLVLPRFVYTTADAFQGDEVADADLQSRIAELVDQICRITSALD